MAATPHGKNKQMARANSLHHGVILKDGYFADDVDSGQLVDRTIMKKGWEPATLYIFGDKTLLRVCFWCDYKPVEEVYRLHEIYSSSLKLITNMTIYTIQ